MADQEYGKWCPNPSDISNPTTQKVRSLMVDCFFEAQKATMVQAGQAIGTETDEESLRSNVEGVIRMAFKEIGGDFNDPTKEDFVNILDVLSRKASAWGTPKDIIEHHRETMSEIIELLP